MTSFNLLKKLSFATAGAASIALGAVNTAYAATIIETFQDSILGRFGEFGEERPGEGNFYIRQTMGQTFTVGSDNVLNDFSFWLDDFIDDSLSYSPDTIDFAAYVMAWDGTKATGNILYESSPKSTTGAADLEQFTFNTGGLSLTTGQQYVAFLSASNFLDGVKGTGQMGGSFNYYSGGKFVYSRNGSNFNALTTQSWSSFGQQDDLAFRATFTPSKPPQSVPEPASVLGLFVVGALSAGKVFKRKKEQ